MNQGRVRMKLNTYAGIAGIIVGLASLFMGALPVTVQAANPALCQDKFVGSTQPCAATTSYPVEGKSPGKFEAGKCYVFANVNKGWEAGNCSDDAFQGGNVTNPTTIPSPYQKCKANPSDPACSVRCSEALQNSGGCNIVERYANPFITALTVLVGLVVVINIILGGIRYSTSRDDPQAVSAAKQRITNAIFGFIAYSLLWAFLQWIVPGGFFG